MDATPPKGSGSPFVFIGLERWAVKAVLGNVELAPVLLVLFLPFTLDEPLLFDNFNRFEGIAAEFEGVPASLFLEEL